MAREKTVAVLVSVLLLAVLGMVLVFLSGSTSPPGLPAPSAGGSTEGPEAAAPDEADPGAGVDFAGDGVVIGRLVTGSRGEPVRGRVGIRGLRTRARSVEAGADGRFTIEGVARGAVFDLEATSGDFLPARYPALRMAPEGLIDLGDILLGGPERVEVEVVDRAGRPVAGATVSLHRSPVLSAGADWVRRELDPDPAPPPLATRTTAGSGIAVFPDAPPGRFAVVATAEGFAVGTASANLIPDRAREPVRVILREAYSLAGRVLGPGEVPLPGVRVRAGNSGGYWSTVFGRVESETGPEGKYRLSGLSEGSLDVTVLVTAEHLVRAGTISIPGVSTFDIRLPEGATVKGRVVADATEEPVEGAAVTVQTWDQTGAGKSSTARALTGPDGTFLVEGVMPGNFSGIQVLKEGFLAWPDPAAGVSGTWKPIAAGSVTETEARLRRGTGIRGTVTDPDGRPVAAAEIRYYTTTSTGILRIPPARTAADGAYALENVPPKTRGLLAVRAEGYHQPDFPRNYWQTLNLGDLPEACAVDVPETGVATKDVTLYPGGSVSGIAVLSDGSPAVGMTVSVSPVSGGIGGGGRAAVSGPDGAFRVTTVTPGEELEAHATGPGGRAGKTGPFTVVEGEETSGIRIEVRAGAKLEGRVVRADGGEVRGVSLRLARGKFEPSRPWEWQSRERNARPCPVKADGTFEIDGIAPGEYTLLAAGEGTASFRSPSLTLEAEETKRGVEVLLPPEAPLAGRVVDESGRPVAGAEVSLQEMGNGVSPYASFGSRTTAAVTDAEGRFRIRGTGKRAYQVTASAPGLVTETVQAKGGAEDLVVTLKGGIAIAGVVVDEATGEPLPGIPVTAGPRIAKPGAWQGGQTTTGADGTFRIEGLPPGDVQLSVGDFWGNAGSDHAPKRIESVSPGTTDLRIALVRGLAISGRLVDDEGHPVASRPGIQAVGQGADGSPDYSRRRWAQAAADGTFRIPGLSDGLYDLTANPQFGPGGAGYTQESVRGIAAGSEGVEIVLRRGETISGRVVDEKGEPWTKGGWIMVTPSGSGPDRSRPPTGTQLEPDGTFTTPALDPGRTWDLTLMASPGGARVVEKGVRPGTKNLVLRLKQGGRITGRVVDPSGSPVANVQVMATDADAGTGPGTAAPAAFGRTDRDGSFSLTNLGPRRFRIAAGGGGSPWRISTAEGIYEPGATGVVVRVEAGVALEGVLRDARGEAVSCQFLQAIHEDGQAMNSAYARPAADGSFAIRGLAPGKVTLTAFVGGKLVKCGTFTAPAKGVVVTVPDE